MRQLREQYRPKKSQCEYLRWNFLCTATTWPTRITRVIAFLVFPRWASVDTLWMLFPIYVIFMVVLLLRKVSFTTDNRRTKRDRYQSVRRFLLTNTVWKLISSMYLVFIITQDEMKKLVLEKNEILNISKSEPHVESYVNDELWNKNTKNQFIGLITGQDIPNGWQGLLKEPRGIIYFIINYRKMPLLVQFLLFEIFELLFW